MYKVSFRSGDSGHELKKYFIDNKDLDNLFNRCKSLLELQYPDGDVFCYISDASNGNFICKVTISKSQPSGKLGYEYVPMTALAHANEVLKWAAESGEYEDHDWFHNPKSARGHYNSILRHLKEWYWEGKEADDESGLHPLSHLLCRVLLLHEGVILGKLNDDRPNLKD